MRRNAYSERMGECDMQVDWATMSGNYANFAGILAGFVFSGIFLLLEDEKRDASEVISIFLSDFLDWCSQPFSRLLQLLNRKIPINRVIYAFMGIFLFFGM